MAVTRKISPDGWALLAIAGAVVLANLLRLLGIFDPNPLGVRSGLIHSSPDGLLPGRGTIDPVRGWISQAQGHRAALDLLHLRMPWWNPYEGTGMPLAAEMQSAALFPPTLLTAISNGQIYERVLLELISGIATYLVLMRLGVVRIAAVAGGIAFALNGTLSWFAHATINPVAFLPLLVLGIEMSYAAALENRPGGWWLIAVAGALSFYAGFPEVAYIDALLAIAWAGWRLACLPGGSARALVTKCAAGAGCGVLLAAPLLVAFGGFVDHSFLALHEGSALGDAHLPASALPQLALPYVYGPIEGFAEAEPKLSMIWDNVGGYLSVSLIFLATLGALAPGRRGLKLVLVGWVVLAGSRMYGVAILGGVLGVLPEMSKVAFYRYAFPSVELAVIVLAALGVHALAQRPPPRRQLAGTVLFVLALLTASALGARALAPLSYYLVSILTALLFVVLIAGVARSENRLRANRAVALVAAEAIILFTIPALSAPRHVRLDTAPVEFLQAHLGEARFFTTAPVHPNYGSYYGIASLGLIDVPMPSVLADYIRSRLDRFADPHYFTGDNSGRRLVVPSARHELVRNLDAYRAAGVAYVLTAAAHPLRESRSTFKQVLRTRTTRIYRVAGAAPYFAAESRHCRTSWEGRDAAQVTCSRPALLVRRETDLPGWTARIDGRPARIERNRGLFQAVAVPDGSHRVRFSYRPPGILWGYAAFAAGCAWLLASAMRPRRRRARR